MPTPPGLIRYFDITRDGEVVADLIEEAFDLKRDSEGQLVLLQMRANARKFQQTPWLRQRLPSNGFVWEVDGRVVGNITIIPQFYPRRLSLIVNVAVDPAFRGQGIGKALVARALSYCRQAGSGEVWLQVRRDNEVAVRMYQQLDFQKDHCLDVWKKPAGHSAGGVQPHHYPNLYEVRSREVLDWRIQKEWLRLNYPPHLRWYTQLDFADLAPWAWLNPFRWLRLVGIEQRSLYRAEKLEAVLSWQKTALRSDNLYIAAPHSAWEGEHVRLLLQRFFQEDWTGKGLTAEYPADKAGEGFVANGFLLTRTLLWMRRYS